MPKTSSVSTAVPSKNPNAMELTGPVEDDFLTPADDDPDLGSHRDDSTSNTQVDDTDDESDDVPTEKIPARLRGKPLAKVYEEFAGLEREYSRQGNELGEARGLLRQTLETVLEQSSKATPTDDESDEVTDEDFQNNPGAAVAKAVKKQVAPLEARAATAEQKLLTVEFNERHPGYLETARSPEFKEFVKASTYRTKLFTKAAKYDMDAAEELFVAYEEHAATKASADEDVDEEPATAKRRQIREVTTEKGGAGRTAGGKGGKKIFKSTDLARLYITDRDRYNEMMPEIKAAYVEGRVK